tara:strand:- start:8827 stop:10155 length:1329 start_codon:yes stop_codon:yes gene_type:complete
MTLSISEIKSIDEKLFSQSLSLAREVFPLHRSITGVGIDQAFSLISQSIPLNIAEFPTGEFVSDWQIPQGWTFTKVSIVDTSTLEEIVSFQHPLRIASHSISVNEVMLGEELSNYIAVSKKYPELLLHRYCYYNDKWSISLTMDEFLKINKESTYKVSIDSSKYDSSLKVGESVLKGTSSSKIFLLSHICHPAQFNDGLVGALLNVYLYNFISANYSQTHHNYHFLFFPETIGSIAYCSEKSKLDNAYFALFSEMTALDQPLHVQQSYNEKDDINMLIKLAAQDLQIPAKFSPFLKVIRNDEKIFNAPGFDVPAASITRALGPGNDDHPFWGYHTNHDTVDNSNIESLQEVLSLYQYLIYIVENDCLVTRLFSGIPMLSRHGLFVDPLVNRPMYNSLEAIVWLIKDPATISSIAHKLNLSFCETHQLFLDWEAEGLVSLSKY